MSERRTGMPLDHAHDALGNCVSQFYNDMLRQGVKELAPRQWVEEFRSWLDEYSFERDYERTKERLAKYDVGKP
jgi:hypothetical protein